MDPHGDPGISRAHRLRMTWASDIQPRPMKWLWEKRLPSGALALLAGREGLGKSIWTAWLVAQLTQGTLPGEYVGSPRSVIIVATEDSWDHVIVPRLMAAGADLERVARLEAVAAAGFDSTLMLPHDNGELEAVIAENKVALTVLDPLISRLDAKLDTHKDAEVRRALEPIAQLADRTQAAFLGLIHVNKSRDADALTSVMGSRAFPGVARAVLHMAADPEDEDKRLLGHSKNQYDRKAATIRLHIESRHVANTAEGPIAAGRVVIEGEVSLSIEDAVSASHQGADVRTAIGKATEWLEALLSRGPAWSADVRKMGHSAGHSESAIKRAAERIGVTKDSKGFPRRTEWRLPTQGSQANPGEKD